MKVALVVVALLMLGIESVAALSRDRIHLVDWHTGVNSYLVRGNEPIQKDSNGNWFVDYPLWMTYIRDAANAKNVTLPVNNSDIYLLDITFENSLNSGFNTEAEWWKNSTNAALGGYLQWLLVGDLVQPGEVSEKEREKMVREGKIWDIDKIPERVRHMKAILEQGPPAGYKALVVYVHCQGGCDRTGEFIAAYRMAYQYAPTLSIQYELDCTECGRCPDWFATGAIGWYCLTWNTYNSTQSTNSTSGSGSGEGAPLPDCLDAYTCDFFKHGNPCQSTGK
jgi:hypothetical protein